MNHRQHCVVCCLSEWLSTVAKAATTGVAPAGGVLTSQRQKRRNCKSGP